MVVVPHQTQTTITAAAIQERIRKKTRTIKLMIPKHETGFSNGDLNRFSVYTTSINFILQRKLFQKCMCL